MQCIDLLRLVVHRNPRYIAIPNCFEYLLPFRSQLLVQLALAPLPPVFALRVDHWGFHDADVDAGA